MFFENDMAENTGTLGLGWPNWLNIECTWCLLNPNDLHRISHRFSNKLSLNGFFWYSGFSWDRWLAKLGVFWPGLWGVWRAFGGWDGTLHGDGVERSVHRGFLHFDQWGVSKIQGKIFRNKTRLFWYGEQIDHLFRSVLWIPKLDTWKYYQREWHMENQLIGGIVWDLQDINWEWLQKDSGSSLLSIPLRSRFWAADANWPIHREKQLLNTQQDLDTNINPCAIHNHVFSLM